MDSFRDQLAVLVRPSVGWFTFVAAVGLTVIGIAAIHLASPGYATRQLQFLPLALLACVAAAMPHHRHYVPWAYPLLILVGLMLVVLLVPGMPRGFVPVRNGARRWFDLGVMSFQPSELAKIAYVLALAVYLRYRENYRTLRGLVPPLVLTFIPMALIVVEPNLGSALIFLPVFFAMMIAAGARLKHMIAIALIGLALMPAMYPLLEPHQQARIVALVSQLRGETRHITGIGFQGYKAQTLVGAGGFGGHEQDHARNLIRFNALPEAQNDMIFAVICTRYGIAGGAVVVGLFIVLIGSTLLAAGLNKDPFARLIAVGVAAVIFTQMFVTIGMTVGLLPITGLNLPFVSYGGSSLLANYIMVGLVLNVAARRPMIMAHPSFEFTT